MLVQINSSGMALQASWGRVLAPSAALHKDAAQSVSSSVVLSPGATRQSLNYGRQTFFGCVHSLKCSPSSRSLRSGKVSPVITALIKRRKEQSFDNVIQREKKLKIVLRIKDLLVKQPGQVMSLRDLGKNRRYIGLTGKRRCIALLQKFPAVFQVYEEGCNAKWFRFTREAMAQYKEETKLKQELEEALVEKLRKLIMMSIDKRVLLEKIGHIRRDLGLPEDFKFNLVHKYPQYFRVVETESGSALELTLWDPQLAVSVIEKQAQKKADERQALEEELAKSPGEDEEIIPRTPRFKKIDLPKGMNLKRKDKAKLLEFQKLPYVSPYSDTSQLNPAAPEAEKHALAVVHELLSLTLEKKLLVDHLTHYRRDYQFSQRVRALLIRHPEVFYVSLKGARDSVFLREAYEGSELKEKDPLVQVKERMAELVARGRKAQKLDDISDDDDDDDEEEEDDDDDDESDWDEDEDDDAISHTKRHGERLLGTSLGTPVGRQNSSSPADLRRELVANRPPRERW